MRFVLLIAVAAACGSVEAKKPDAGTGHDGPGSGGQMDAPADASNVPFTAIGAGSITQFSPASLVWTKVPYVVDYDDQSEWSNSTSAFTAKYDGDYLVCASVSMGSANLNTSIDLDIYKNGTIAMVIGHGHGIANGCATIRIAANDILNIDVFLGNQNTTAVIPDANWDYLTIERVNEVASATTDLSFASTAGQFVQVPYDSTTVNDGSLYDMAAHQLKPTAAGDFQLCASLGLSDPTLEGELDIYINGTREKTMSNGVGIVGGCRPVRAAANDLVDVRFFQNTANSTVPTDANENDWLTIQKQPISVSVGTIAAFSTVSHTFGAVGYTAATFDDASQWSSTTHLFKAATAGDYEICASVLVPLSTVDGDEIDVFKNGTREKGLSYGHFGLSGCRVMRLAANDQVGIEAYTQGNKSFVNDANWDWLEVSKLH